MSLNLETARAIIEAAHSAWNTGCLEGVLDKYTEDFIYLSNTEGGDGGPLIIHGKDAFRDLIAPILLAVESTIAIEGFHFQNGVARIRLSTFVRHKTTGHVLTGSIRQLVCFRGFQICRIEDFRDAAKMKAFWEMVRSDASNCAGDGSSSRLSRLHS